MCIFDRLYCNDKKIYVMERLLDLKSYLICKLDLERKYRYSFLDIYL